MNKLKAARALFFSFLLFAHPSTAAVALNGGSAGGSFPRVSQPVDVHPSSPYGPTAASGNHNVSSAIQVPSSGLRVEMRREEEEDQVVALQKNGDESSSASPPPVQKYARTRVLITGITGMIASYIARAGLDANLRRSVHENVEIFVATLQEVVNVRDSVLVVPKSQHPKSDLEVVE